MEADPHHIAHQFLVQLLPTVKVTTITVATKMMETPVISLTKNSFLDFGYPSRIVPTMSMA